MLGQHNEEILASHLGSSHARVEELERTGVLYREPR